MFCRRRKAGRVHAADGSSSKGGLLARLNRSLTEVGTQHFDDDLDWDARVKLPEWQLSRLKQRHAQRRRKPAANRSDGEAEPQR